MTTPTRHHESAWHHEQALGHFTDRHFFKQRFAEYLNSDPAKRTILFLHGAGGNGKSLLLKFLRRCCYVGYQPHHERPPDSAQPIPFAYVDFEMKPEGDNRPREPFYGPLFLRRELRVHGLRFPLYDFASIWYLRATGQLDNQRLNDLFRPEDLACCSELLGLFAGREATDTLSAVMGIIGTGAGPVAAVFTNLQQRLKPWVTYYASRRRLTRERLDEITRMDPRSTLVDELPRLLAEDLNDAIRESNLPGRLVLFFDGHESFWGAEGHSVGARHYEQDRWLRCLLTNLQRSAGIVPVVAGRNRPHWPAVPDDEVRIPDADLDVLEVGNLLTEHAAEYLDKEQVADPTLREDILAYTAVGQE